jgi:hypothetical protein
MDNSFTHILCVKVWSPHLKITSNYGNVLSIIKNLILDTNMHVVTEIDGKSLDTIINWKVIQFDPPYDEMFSGNLVANVSSNFDSKIYEYTKEILQNIEENLENEKRLNGEKILFTIVKNIL